MYVVIWRNNNNGWISKAMSFGSWRLCTMYNAQCAMHTTSACTIPHTPRMADECPDGATVNQISQVTYEYSNPTQLPSYYIKPLFLLMQAKLLLQASTRYCLYPASTSLFRPRPISSGAYTFHTGTSAMASATAFYDFKPLDSTSFTRLLGLSFCLFSMSPYISPYRFAVHPILLTSLSSKKRANLIPSRTSKTKSS